MATARQGGNINLWEAERHQLERDQLAGAHGLQQQQQQHGHHLLHGTAVGHDDYHDYQQQHQDPGFDDQQNQLGAEYVHDDGDADINELHQRLPGQQLQGQPLEAEVQDDPDAAQGAYALAQQHPTAAMTAHTGRPPAAAQPMTTMDLRKLVEMIWSRNIADRVVTVVNMSAGKPGAVDNSYPVGPALQSLDLVFKQLSGFKPGKREGYSLRTVQEHQQPAPAVLRGV